jgi:hypothetical protein
LQWWRCPIFGSSGLAVKRVSIKEIPESHIFFNERRAMFMIE